MTSIQLSAIVVSYNTCDLTRRCIESVRDATRGLAAEVWVVDNASADGTVAMLRTEFPHVRVVANDTNRGYGAAANQGMRCAPGGTFLILNADVTVNAAAVVSMLAVLGSHPRVAIVAPRLVGVDGQPRPSARRFPRLLTETLTRFRIRRLLPKRTRSRVLLGDDALPEDSRRPDWVTGACLLVRREVFEQVGGFDESIFLYGEELDWCARVRRTGWQVACDPDAAVVHVGRASSGPQLERRRLRLSLEGDLRYLARYRGKAALSAFALGRALGLTFELALAALMLDRRAFDIGAYQLGAHLGLSLRYAIGSTRPPVLPVTTDAS